MSYKRRFRVKETSTTTGTGTLQLAGAEAAFRSFVSAVGTTNRCSYVIFESGTGAAERGIGTVTSGAPNTLSRDIVLESTNGGALVNLAAGTKMVFIDSDPHVVSGPFVDAIAKSGNYTVTFDDAGVMIEVTTGASDVTITLPALASVWPGFSVGVRKVDTGAGRVIVDGNASEQVDGYLTRKLWSQYDQVILTKGSGASWACLASIADRIVTFTASGTWTKEDGLASLDDVEVQAGGGAGGAGHTADGAAGSGGGGGGYARKGRIAAAALGATETVTVGVGGTGAATTNGGDGGSSSFGSHVSATGGSGGSASSSASATTFGSAGGIGSGGDLNCGGDGGGPGSGPGLFAGNGGSSPLGGGGRATTSSGTLGRDYGGAGSGGRRTGGVNTAGGNGAPGVVRVRERYR